MPHRTDKIIPPKAVTTGTMITGQIRPDETSVQSYPLRDGIHDGDLDLEAIQVGRNHDPTVGIMAPRSSRQQGDRRPRGGHQLLYDAPENRETMTKTMMETMSHRTASASPPCLQCHHNRHRSTTPHTMPQRGHKTMTTATPGRDPEDGVACKPS
jgi:hypothetical protein